MKKTTRNILIVVGSIVLAIGIVLAIVLPLTLGSRDVEYTVTFDSNGGTEVASVTVKRNCTVAEPTAPTRTGYVFDGWFSDGTLNTPWKFASDTVKGDMTLYAKWTYNATEGLSFTLNERGDAYTVIGIGSVTDKDVIIPARHNNLPVTIIAANAFLKVNSIESVYVPSSVTSIKSCAFRECENLITVTLDCNAKIEMEVFAYCAKLQKVVLPANLTNVPARTFRMCESLTDIVIPSTVTSIGVEAFSDCTNLSSISFPDGISSFDDKAFAGCSALTSVNLPASVRTLGEKVFTGCQNIETLTVDSHNAYYFSEGNCIIYRGVTEGSTALNTLVVGCKNSVIPASVRIIGEGAFQGCQQLESISIPTSVTEISDYAFAGCSGLTQMIIPSSVKKIGDYAFSDCTYLNTVVFRPQIGDGETTVEYGIESLGREAFSHCELVSFNIPNSVKKIGAGLFYGFRDERLATGITYSGTRDELKMILPGSNDNGSSEYTEIIYVRYSDGESNGQYPANYLV